MATASFAAKPTGIATPIVTPIVTPIKGPAIPLTIELVAPGACKQVVAYKPSNSFFTGEEEGTPDASDVRPPRLNMIQGLSKEELKKVGKEGDWVLKGSVLLSQPVTLVAVGHRAKVWIEKVKQGDQARYAHNLQEVFDFGGTDQWNLSKLNDKIESKRIWFMPSVTWMLLIQRPDGAPGDNFTSVSDDGIAFAVALYTTKSTSYGGFHVPLASEKATGLLRSGYFTRFVELTSQKGLKHAAFEPRVHLTTVTSEAVRALAKKVAATLAS